MREFETGATRDDDDTKLDFEGFLNPLVLERFGQYMLKHQVQADGALRSSDNWQKGMTKDAYIKSGLRHVHDWWMEHRGYTSREGLQDALCAVMFNVMGYLLEELRDKEAKIATVNKLSPIWNAPYEFTNVPCTARIESDRHYTAESESDKAYYPPTHRV